MALAGLEGLLDRPAAAGDADQGGQWLRGGCPGQVVGELAGVRGVAHEQPPVGAVVGYRDPGPVVVAGSLGALNCAVALPAAGGEAGDEPVDAVPAGGRVTGCRSRRVARSRRRAGVGPRGRRRWVPYTLSPVT